MALLRTIAWLLCWGGAFTAIPLATQVVLSRAYAAIAGDVFFDPVWTPLALLCLSAFLAGLASRELADRFLAGRDGMAMLPLMLTSQLVFAAIAYMTVLQHNAGLSPLTMALALPIAGMAGVACAPKAWLTTK